MLDPVPDDLDPEELAELRQSLEEMRYGQTIEAAELHARLRRRFLGH
jgi:hypothetical protein